MILCWVFLQYSNENINFGKKAKLFLWTVYLHKLIVSKAGIEKTVLGKHM